MLLLYVCATNIGRIFSCENFVYLIKVVSLKFGDVAQLVECLNGIQKVRGSIPLISIEDVGNQCHFSCVSKKLQISSVCVFSYKNPLKKAR